MMTDTICLLTLEETAAALRLSPHTIRAFVRQGKLLPVRICRRLLFRPADVEKLIAGCCTSEER
jgi:excisionase family DNA binding protein